MGIRLKHAGSPGRDLVEGVVRPAQTTGLSISYVVASRGTSKVRVAEFGLARVRPTTVAAILPYAVRVLHRTRRHKPDTSSDEPTSDGRDFLSRVSATN
eukprot:scaffold412372_cov32-Prasinocladus_malaysianus.AAC.1